MVSVCQVTKTAQVELKVDECKPLLKGVRHFCEVLMNRCFPSHGVWEEMHHGAGAGGGGDAPGHEAGAAGGGAGGGAGGTDEAAARLHEYFVRHHCDLLTCEGVPRLFHLLGGHHVEFPRGIYLTLLVVAGGVLRTSTRPTLSLLILLCASV